MWSFFISQLNTFLIILFILLIVETHLAESPRCSGSLRLTSQRLYSARSPLVVLFGPKALFISASQRQLSSSRTHIPTQQTDDHVFSCRMQKFCLKAQHIFQLFDLNMPVPESSQARGILHCDCSGLVWLKPSLQQA